MSEISMTKKIINAPKVIFIDTSTLSESYNSNFTFNYGKDEGITNLAFSPCLFLEYIGFSGSYLKNYLDELISAVSLDSLANSPSTIGNFYLQLYFIFREHLDKLHERLISIINEKTNIKLDYLSNNPNEISNLYKAAIVNCNEHNNLVGAIKDYLSFNCALGWIFDCGKDRSTLDEAVKLEQILEFASAIANKQACERLEINPLRILMNNTGHFLEIYNSSLDVSDFKCLRNLFRVMKKYNKQLSSHFYKAEEQMGDLDILWHSYTGYYWNRHVNAVIACTHDKKDIDDLMRWKECFLYALSKIGSVRYTSGGRIVIFHPENSIPNLHIVKKVKL